MRFSDRIPAPSPNRLAVALERARADRRPLFDLTVTNPTAAGLDEAYRDAGLDALRLEASARYRPDPRGLGPARARVAAEIERSSGVITDPADLLLCSCSSEAYGLLLKLLCDPGDGVLVPRPSYPLLEHLVRLEGAVPLPYRLRHEGRWLLEPGEIELAAAAGPDHQPRALLVVNPNNPTGSYVDPAEARALHAACRDGGAGKRALALISDEVFFDYPLEAKASPAASLAAAGDEGALTFVIGGLSKLAGLPHLKLSWIALRGPEDLRRAAASRLELIADTYLSVATPVQLGIDRLLAAGEAIRTAVRQRTARNLAALRAAVAAQPSCDLLATEGGWSAVVRVPALRDEEQLVLELLELRRTVVHPGYFFDFERGAHLVISLLCEPALFDEGVQRAVEHACTLP